MMDSCWAYSSTLKMKVTSVDFQQITWRYIPEDRTLHFNKYQILGKCVNLRVIQSGMSVS
jgi:hypothetical protein